jgi:hypothetical protein
LCDRPQIKGTSRAWFSTGLDLRASLRQKESLLPISPREAFPRPRARLWRVKNPVTRRGGPVSEGVAACARGRRCLRWRSRRRRSIWRHHRRHSRHRVARGIRLDRIKRHEIPVCRFAQVRCRAAAMLDIAESDREGSSYDRRMDPSGARRVRVDRENDRMVLHARPAIRSRIRQSSLARRTTFLTGSCPPTSNQRAAERWAI